jgi:tagaturonate reductase
MGNAVFSQYITQLMEEGIVPALVGGDIDEAEANGFAKSVLDRYRNPFIDHKWLSICVQYSAKMNMRCAPQIAAFNDRFSSIHPAMSLGLAAHFLFMKVVLQHDGTYAGNCHNVIYAVTDANAAIFAAAWQQDDTAAVVHRLLADSTLWSINLLEIEGLATSTTEWLNHLIHQGALASMELYNQQKNVATNVS